MKKNTWSNKETLLLLKIQNLPIIKQEKLLDRSYNSIAVKRHKLSIKKFSRGVCSPYKNKVCVICSKPFFGKRNTCGSKNCISIRISILKKGKLNVQWKGDEVGYNALHKWIRKNKPKPLLCVRCNLRHALDLANISGLYKRDVNDFEWLCRRCHILSDNRKELLYKGIVKNPKRDKKGRFIK